MRRWVVFMPLVGLVVFAGYLGLRAGDIPTETDIINRYAAVYLTAAPDGAAPTDCAAAPHPAPDIRMVINCAHSSGLTTTYYVGARGQSMPDPTTQEPVT
jgi:hypothetical protein